MRERYAPIVATVTVFVLLFLGGSLMYRHFFSTLVVTDLLTDNAFVIIAAIGETFVIISGGIDLSVGSMIGFVGVAMAFLVSHGWHPLAASLLLLAFGIVYGGIVGLIIDTCDIQPFIITLTGLFLLRGLCFVVSLDSVPIHHPFVDAFAGWRSRCRGAGRSPARRS